MAKYYIRFDTREAPGYIKATSVEIKSEYVKNNKHLFKINLVDDPLYLHLLAYITANKNN